jgi:uncharacterized protein YhjY with autotransporter beta-barrel domain
MAPRSLVLRFLRTLAAPLPVACAALVLAVAPARAQGAPYTLTPTNPTVQSVREGRSLNLRVRLTVGTQPVPGQRIDWVVVSSTANASGPATSITDSTGQASARFLFPRVGTTTVEARHPGATPVRWTVTSVPRPVAPGPAGVVLEPVGPTGFDLVLGDRQELSVRLRTGSGQPVRGESVLFAVETSPGSPGVGRSNQTVTTGEDGVASATFGFSTAGLATILASVPNRDSDPDFVRFSIDTASLGALDRSRRSYVSLGEALDEVCRDVFVDREGRQRPVPQPTPLCGYMTGTLTTREGRTEAMHELTSTGVGSQTQAALAGLSQQSALVRARIERVRLAARAGDGGPRDQIALQVGGAALSDELVASALAARGAADGFDRALDRAFARLYAGLDAEETQAAAAPATAPRRERPWGFFVTGRLTEGEGEAGVEEDAFDFDTAGVTLGFDRALSANGFLGFAVSAHGNETELLGGGGDLEADSLSFTVYAIGDGEHGYVQGTASYGQDEYQQRRRLLLPAIGELTARGDFDGEQLGATIELGRSFDGRAGSLTVFARGSFARASIDGFRETGAVAPLPPFGNVDFGLEVDEQEVDSLLGEAGLDWGRAISFPGGVVLPQLGLSWTREFEDDPTAVGARLISDTSLVAPFLIFTDAPDRDWLRASASLRFQFLWGSLFVAYDQDLQRDDLETRTVNAGLRFDF